MLFFIQHLLYSHQLSKTHCPNHFPVNGDTTLNMHNLNKRHVSVGSVSVRAWLGLGRNRLAGGYTKKKELKSWQPESRENREGKSQGQEYTSQVTLLHSNQILSPNSTFSY